MRSFRLELSEWRDAILRKTRSSHAVNSPSAALLRARLVVLISVVTLLSAWAAVMVDAQVLGRGAPARERTSPAVGAGEVAECPSRTQSVFLPAVIQTGQATTDFSFGLDTTCVMVLPGYTGTATVLMRPGEGFGDSVALSLEGTPSGVTGTFGSSSLSGSSVSALTLNAARSVPTGTYTLTVKGSATGKVKSADLTLVVAPATAISGTVEYDTGGGVTGAQVVARSEDGRLRGTGTTGTNGAYSLELPILTVPSRVLVSTTVVATGQVTLINARWITVTTRGQGAVGRLMVPNPVGAQMAMTGTTAATADGSLAAEGLPASIRNAYGRAYDPDANRDAFPGEFAESGRIPLNSSGFVWMEALDSTGVRVSQVPSITIRSIVSRSQWADLEDLRTGTDRIEIPIYTYNDQTHQWTEQDNGWLEDGNRTVLPEDAQATILSGAFSGQIYAVFTTTHLSYMNVDYSYIGPWTLSKLSREKRNSDCLYKAMKLAEAIFRTSWANQAYKGVNKAGKDLDLKTEVKDREGPEINADKMDEYGHTTPKDFKDNLHVNEKFWDKCDTAKQQTIFMLALTIVHETAHWKHDNKKFDGKYTAEDDVDGEGGFYTEERLLGDKKHLEGPPFSDDVTRDGKKISDDQLKKLSDPQWWKDNDSKFSADFWKDFWAGAGAKSVSGRAADQASPLQMTVSLTGTLFDLGAPIPVVVEYRNVSADPLGVLGMTFVEGYPLYFDIRASDGTKVPFQGPKIHHPISTTDFVQLAPGSPFTRSLDLTRDLSSTVRYNFPSGGVYTATAYYAPFYGITKTASNVLTLTVGSGGSISGTVTNATDGSAMSGASVSVIAAGNVLTTATTSATGRYFVPELPAGTYVVEATAPGFLRSSQSAIIQARTGITVNFSLSPLLSRGELRLVLNWGASPSDLDSHLWLPADTPYHLYYSRRGITTTCPWANLDVDARSGFGPETITIKQRVVTGTYTYAAYNFSGSPSITTSKATVEVFDSTGRIFTASVPTQTVPDARWWDVLRIDGPTGRITAVNQLTTSVEPYADTESGCTSQSSVAGQTRAAGETKTPAPPNLANDAPVKSAELVGRREED